MVDKDYGFGFIDLPNGFRIEAWLEPYRDMLYLKFRRWEGEDKRGVIFRFTEEVLCSMMPMVSEGEVYPQRRLTPPLDQWTEKRGVIGT